jgi:hypothetical protein
VCSASGGGGSGSSDGDGSDGDEMEARAGARAAAAAAEDPAEPEFLKGQNLEEPPGLTHALCVVRIVNTRARAPLPMTGRSRPHARLIPHAAPRWDSK